MRVALVSYNAQAADAIGNQVAEKLAFFLDRGADVRVFVQSGQRLHPALRPHCRVMPAPEPKGEAWRFLASADLVIVEYGQYYRLLELLPLLAGGKGRVLFDYHGVTPTELWPAHNREAVEAGARQRGLVWAADAAVVHSQFTYRELRDVTAFPLERCFCLGHPIDLGFFGPGPAAGRLGHGSQDVEVSMLLFVGRLAPNKRAPILIEALARLQDFHPPVHAVLVGDTTDAYEAEARHCRELAKRRGVADRLQFLGQVGIEQLRDIYRSADVLVIPSCHEGFCIPVIEAMACGLPVVATRAAALPETVGGAGLTFIPDDPGDLERQLRRVLGSRRARSAERGAQKTLPIRRSVPHSPRLRIAIVAFRYGTSFAGGAERSLRTIAEVLHGDGQHVEVLTTCTLSESAWSNEVPEGTVHEGGVAVHRYPIDPHDRAGHLASVRAVLQAEGPVGLEIEREYLAHSIHSGRLIEALRNRAADFDAIITGPYLFGLTREVARTAPDKTLLVPCFHDEPFAQLPVWAEYERVGGILYHSVEEKEFAESRLGINHPGGMVVGGVVAAGGACSSEATSEFGLAGRRYLIYCGRYSAQKGLPILLDWTGRYAGRHPQRFAFVFIGQGEVPVPRNPGFRDLGFVAEASKHRLLAGADALIQLSRYESLSYAALEAWVHGTPVIADRRCEVLAAHLRRCAGGRAVESFEDFARALDNLWEHPDHWQALGRQGREYVEKEYASGDTFCRQIKHAIRELSVPLAKRMRRAGLEQASRFARPTWRDRFAEIVESVLDAGPRPYRDQVEVTPRSASRTVVASSGAALVPVRIVNRGSHVVLAEGPARAILCCQVIGVNGELLFSGDSDMQLPGLLVPGRALAAAVSIQTPEVPGNYRVDFWAERVAWDSTGDSPRRTSSPLGPVGSMRLMVEGQGAETRESCCTPFLETVRGALVEAQERRDLPSDYLDVTQGWLAGLKRRIKRKLLGNFKHAYVDVLSRQQSAFNRLVLTALGELGECCATLDHAIGRAELKEPPAAGVKKELADVLAQLAQSQERCALLEERLARLEAKIQEQQALSSES